MRSEFGGAVGTWAEGDRDAQLKALAHPHRRRLLKYLLEAQSAGVTQTAAAAHLAGTTNQDYHKVEAVLVHRHLPKLEDAGVVTYDSTEERLTYTGGKFVTDVLNLL